jgi:cell envelope opacity-associated protein A
MTRGYCRPQEWQAQECAISISYNNYQRATDRRTYEPTEHQAASEDRYRNKQDRYDRHSQQPTATTGVQSIARICDAHILLPTAAANKNA